MEPDEHVVVEGVGECRGGLGAGRLARLASRSFT